MLLGSATKLSGALCVLALIACVLVPSQARAQARDAPTVAQMALVADHEPPLLAERGSRYRYLMLRDSVRGHVPPLRQANPRTSLLVYKDAAFTTREPGCPWSPFQGSLVDWCTVSANPGWFLTDRRTGQPAVSEGYPENRAVDISHPGYQQAAIDAALARLRDARGDGSGVRWDGIFLDDVNLFPGHGLNGNLVELSDTEYREATIAFVAKLSAALRSEGFEVAANVGMDPWDSAQVSALPRLARHLDIVFREYFIRFGEGVQRYPLFSHPDAGRGDSWLEGIRRMRRLQRDGTAFVANVYGRKAERRVQRYVRASFLLAYRRGSGSALVFRATGGVNPYGGPWVREMGVPRGSMRRSGRGFMRRYSRGTVIVNPHPRRRARFRFKAPHRNGGRCLRRIKLGPARGAMLTRCRR